MSTAARFDTDPGGAAPTVVCNRRQPDEIVADAIEALVRANDPPQLFLRAGEIVRVVQDEEDRATIASAGDDVILERLYAASRWYKHERNKLVDTDPPRKIATAARVRILAGGAVLPPLAGVVSAPTVRRDGSILATPGYDAASRLYLAPEPGLDVPAIPDTPDARDVADAVDWIDGVLQDMPYVDESDRASAFAIALTLAMREAIPGCVPLYSVTAKQQGTGKGLLLQALVTIATGRGASASSMPVGRSAEDELRKRILTILRAGRRVAVLDNVTRPIDSASLAGLVTAERWTDRILGVSADLDLRNATTWIVTGNNVAVRGDFVRRVVWCRLNAQHARPWTRSGFRHADLLAYVNERRGVLLGAVLTIARAWFAAGCPDPPETVPRMGGFDGWRRVVGGAIAHAGVAGFLGAAEQMFDLADDEGPAWAAFLSAWREWCADAVPVAELVAELRREGSSLAEALPAELAPLLEHVRSAGQRIGSALLTREGRRFAIEAGCIWVERAGRHGRTKAALWRVHRED